ncbi:IPT/TIG domain-containing protein [Steroidobacter flavus]|uniref:IPT/TIG domain-containing protein n=1 Tax=Steroidobacter flavus TaxID=1842136 RepID=A0ABV8T686_9GAMM
MIKRILPVLPVWLLLAGCGGGGGDGGGSESGGNNRGTFTVSPSTLTFTAASVEGSTIPSQTITGTVSGVSAETLYINVRVTGNAVAAISNIRITGPTSGTATVQPITQHVVGPGTFTSTLTVVACTSGPECTSGVIGSPQTVNVTYNVTGVRSSVAQLGFGPIGDRIAATDLNRTFAVTGYPAQNWTAASSVPWLTVNPASGNAGAETTVTASLVQAQVEALASGAYEGTITLTPTSGAPVTIPVTLSSSRVRVNHVAPYVAQAGTSDTVIIRGENLSRYPATAVRFGSTDAVSFTPVSDTEIHAVHPALVAGSYDVHVLNAQGIDNTRAALVVVDPPAYAPAALAYPVGGNRFPRCFQYDAERRALIVGVLFNDSTINSSRVLRYTHASGWGAPTSVTLTSDGSCALSADGKQLIVGYAAPNFRAFTVAELDPVTLTELRKTVDPRQLSLDARGIAVANDGRAVFVTEYSRGGDVKSYWPLRPEIGDFKNSGSIYTIGTYDGQIGGSGDGSLVLLGSWYGGGSDTTIARYESSTQLARTSLNLSLDEPIVINRTGSRVIMNHRNVYDRDLTAIGTLPSTTLVAALAPSLMRAYTYDNNGTIRTFDVTAAVSGAFAEIELPRTPTSNPGTTGLNRLLVTPDGRALFVMGQQQIVLVPL